jgi:CRISPR type III-B/RAMP module-associated protein Cmr5
MSLEAKIAGKAKELVAACIESNKEHPKETAYRALCESFPILLRTCGLANTLGYLDAKSGENGDDEYATLRAHLRQQLAQLGFSADPGGLATADYMLYSRLALRIAMWHKRLAQALLRKKDE